ncbi:MAG: hypothetical protein HOC71_17155 [Candidatus Latescibacteria bacterium]|jgi:hypothetical protein|nr:hypothetical protein [Candidatus Latescibacterota bacterium]
MKNCKKIQSWLLEAFYDELNEEQKMLFEDHLRKCPDCAGEFKRIKSTLSQMANYKRPEPGTEFWDSYWDKLYYRLETSRKSYSIRKWWKKRYERSKWGYSRLYKSVAVAAVFIIGIVIGMRINYGFRYQGEMAQLREEVHEMRQLVTKSLIDQPSAIKRLHGLSMSSYVKDPDEQFLSLLLVILNSDPNINVRLAAVNALRTFCDSPWVRTELASSLSNQTSPLVQISLIDLLVEVQEQGAFAVFRALIDDQKSIEDVKKRAEWGINQII